jgi:hypothetical protein
MFPRGTEKSNGHHRFLRGTFSWNQWKNLVVTVQPPQVDAAMNGALDKFGYG